MDKDVLGLPIVFKDLIDDKIKFRKPVQNIDINDYLEKSDTYSKKNRNINIKLNVDYSKQVITYKFIGLLDVVSHLGGYKGAFEPVFMYFFPMIIL